MVLTSPMPAWKGFPWQRRSKYGTNSVLRVYPRTRELQGAAGSGLCPSPPPLGGTGSVLWWHWGSWSEGLILLLPGNRWRSGISGGILCVYESVPPCGAAEGAARRCWHRERRRFGAVPAESTTGQTSTGSAPRHILGSRRFCSYLFLGSL